MCYIESGAISLCLGTRKLLQNTGWVSKVRQKVIVPQLILFVGVTATYTGLNDERTVPQTSLFLYTS